MGATASRSNKSLLLARARAPHRARMARRRQCRRRRHSGWVTAATVRVLSDVSRWRWRSAPPYPLADLGGPLWRLRWPQRPSALRGRRPPPVARRPPRLVAADVAMNALAAVGAHRRRRRAAPCAIVVWGQADRRRPCPPQRCSGAAVVHLPPPPRHDPAPLTRGLAGVVRAVHSEFAARAGARRGANFPAAGHRACGACELKIVCGQAPSLAPAELPATWRGAGCVRWISSITRTM